MTFLREYYRTLVPDWHDYYVNLDYLSEELARIEKLAREAHSAARTFALQRLQRDFAFTFQGEIIKFCGFFKLSFARTLRPKLVQLRLNIAHYPLIADAQKKREAYFAVQRALLMYYKELHLFRRYLDSNVECVETLCGVYRQIFSELGCYDPRAVAQIHLSLRQSFPVAVRPELEQLVKTVSRAYVDFCVHESRDERRAELHAVVSEGRLRPAQLVLTGVFVGVFALACCIAAFLLYEVDFFNSRGGNFVTFSFPVFRGTLTLLLYVLSTGVCVHVWERYNINYRRAFEISEQHLRPSQIFTLGFAFLCLWVAAFLYCGFAALNQKSRALHAFFQPAVAHWLPPALYLLIALYAFFPSARLLQGDMRLYVARAAAVLVRFPFHRFGFREKFAVSQLSSFKPFFRDLGYALCYAHNLRRTGRQDNRCADARAYLYFEFFLTLLPLVVSATQTLREVALAKERMLSKLYTCLGLLLTVLTTFEPQRYSRNPSLAVLFYVLLALNTLAFYYDDVVCSWKFLQPRSVHPLLRDVLALPRPAFYYFALFSNLFLRFFWTLSLLPLRFFENQLLENLFGLAAVFVETFRRTVGNILKVEVQHWEGVGNFNVVQSLPLPFFGELAEVARRPGFDQEYREALHHGDYYELEIAATQFPPIEPYEHLHHSFTEDELREFAKKRNLQLIKKSGKVAKLLQRIERKSLGKQFGGRALLRRDPTRKWNDDLSLNLSSILPSRDIANARRRNSLNKSFPGLGAQQDNTSGDDVEMNHPQPFSRLHTVIPVNKSMFKDLAAKDN